MRGESPRRSPEVWGVGAAVVGNRIVSGDLNGDGFPDLLIHAIGSNNREVVGSGTHLVNDGDLDLYSGVFTTPSLVQSPPSAADLDRSQLLLNDGHGVFTPAAPSAVQPNNGMPTCGASFTDVDRDARVDLLLSFHHSNNAPNRPQLLLGAGDGTFVDVSSDSGVGVSGTRRIAFGTTACDLDDNGIPELLVNAYARGPNVLLQADPNATAPRSGTRTRCFGLGGCGVVHALEVTWPDLARTVQRFEDVAADRVVELRQRDPAVYEALAPAP